jgi:hypothetical protein
MIRPVRFAFNEQTAGSNAFQDPAALQAAEDVQGKALAEFDALVDSLRSHGVDVTVVSDTPEPHTPDAIFPNNWVSFHDNGTVCLYPMFAPNRRLERRPEVIEGLKRRFLVDMVLDFSDHEQSGRFLEALAAWCWTAITALPMPAFHPVRMRSCSKSSAKQCPSGW